MQQCHEHMKHEYLKPQADNEVVTEITSMDRKVRFSTFETDEVERGIKRKGTGSINFIVSLGPLGPLTVCGFESKGRYRY